MSVVSTKQNAQGILFARFSTNPIAETGLFDDGLSEEQELVRNTLRSLHPQHDELPPPSTFEPVPVA